MNSASPPGLDLHLFGGVTLGSTALPGPRAKALVLSLALSRGRPVSAAALIEDAWGDAPTGASTALHTMVSRIRINQWHGLIISIGTGYALGIEPSRIDFWAVESLLAAARAELADPTRPSPSTGSWPSRTQNVRWPALPRTRR
ncbi:helix-turn-helix domain-containing protein [Arthrobacter alpinus]|uniref:AfsR/SARP family transcriptional regulator n=1 Tax=Arthrobacter alpinus TaxID=656366 RepID=UPI0016471AA8|nr:helix-turn-helix domain-containing protein [Arthrobacter alpinus]